ncbi:hypothetical protein [Lentzea cavernae]|uniref:hypothetical protein n=1 Tax=Lentzea cavernae TaxID=2020703 RepID=UPI00174D8969|nr:hypothetical protein [Lentzea cavernae]
MAVLWLCGCSTTEPTTVDLSVPEQGWGPPRPMFTASDRPAGAVLNSVSDDPAAGDERSFLSVRTKDAEDWTTSGSLVLEPGGQYEASISVHNDARPGTGAASTETRVQAQLPATVDGRERISAVLTSGSAEPPSVWRSLVLASSEHPVLIRIVPDSAVLRTGRLPQGLALSAEDLFSKRGVLIGCDGLTGNITGEDDCRAEVRFRFVADHPNFTITQRVAKRGSGNYEYTPRVTPADELDIKVKYENTGTIQQDDVVIRIELPSRFEPITGTTHVANSSTEGKWTRIDGDEVTRRGVNLGSYAVNGVSYVRTSIRIVDHAELSCGTNAIVSRAVVETQNGSKSHDLTVEVERPCR